MGLLLGGLNTFCCRHCLSSVLFASGLLLLCFSQLGDGKLPSSVGNKPTMDTYVIQPHFKKTLTVPFMHHLLLLQYSMPMLRTASAHTHAASYWMNHRDEKHSQVNLQALVSSNRLHDYRIGGVGIKNCTITVSIIFGYNMLNEWQYHSVWLMRRRHICLADLGVDVDSNSVYVDMTWT